jgi:hypothetical protein
LLATDTADQARRAAATGVEIALYVVLGVVGEQRVLDLPYRLFGADRELQILFLESRMQGVSVMRVNESEGETRTVILSQYLYTIITLSSMQRWKKNKPSM